MLHYYRIQCGLHVKPETPEYNTEDGWGLVGGGWGGGGGGGRGRRGEWGVRRVWLSGDTLGCYGDEHGFESALVNIR